MRCLIPSVNFKVLGKAITTLSRIGDELYVEPHKDGIYFRTVNSVRSAFASFNFSKSFFSYYSLDATSLDQTGHHSTRNVAPTDNGEVEPTKCKVAMKSVLAVFRTPSNIVETCQLQLEPDGGQLVLQLRCKHSIRKTYYVPVIECETVQAVYNKDTVPNNFCAQSKVLSEVLQNFQNNHEEISLTVSPIRIIFRNYSDVAADSRRAAVRTELCLEPLEFDSLTVGIDTTVTFSLRELRALLMFAEATSLPVAAHFDVAGRPMVFTVSSLPTFEAHFVLATMTQQLSESQSHSQASSSASSSISNTRGRKRPVNTLSNSLSDAEREFHISNHIAEIHTGEEREDQAEMETAEADMDAQQAAATTAAAIQQKTETPPTLRAQRFFFPRCFKNTQELEDSGPPPVVLCPDSDPEELY